MGAQNVGQPQGIASTKNNDSILGPPPRRLSENSNFVQNRGIPEKIPQVYGLYSEDIFSGITKSLDKIAFSDRLLKKTRAYSWYKILVTLT